MDFVLIKWVIISTDSSFLKSIVCILSMQISYKRRVKVSLFCCNQVQIGAVLKVRIISNKDA